MIYEIIEYKGTKEVKLLDIEGDFLGKNVSVSDYVVLQKKCYRLFGVPSLKKVCPIYFSNYRSADIGKVSRAAQMHTADSPDICD